MVAKAGPEDITQESPPLPPARSGTPASEAGKQVAPCCARSQLRSRAGVGIAALIRQRARLHEIANEYAVGIAWIRRERGEEPCV